MTIVLVFLVSLFDYHDFADKEDDAKDKSILLLTAILFPTTYMIGSHMMGTTTRTMVAVFAALITTATASDQRGCA